MKEICLETGNHPYYIFAPAYREQSSGIRVMHRLCHLLNNCGCEAYIVGTKVLNPELRTPYLDDKIALGRRRKNRIPIAVYPEIVTGNPLNASVCVRYMLNKEGVIDGNRMNAGPEDLFFYYSKAFTPNTHEKFDYLRLHTHDLNLFKPDPLKKKKGPLLYLNRIPESAVDFSTLPNNIEILSNQNPLNTPDLAKKLQSATALYSYEASGTCTLAMLCGCPVVAMTLPGYEKLGFSKQSLSPYGGLGYALTDSESDLQAARDSLPRLRQGILNVEREFTNELQVFIEKTQAKANDIVRSKLSSPPQNDVYQDWVATHRFPADDIRRLEQILAQLADPPQFHITVVHDSNTSQGLARTLRPLADQHYPYVSETCCSVSKQTYPDWRLTYVAQMPAPHEVELLENIAWADVSGLILVEEVNRIALENDDSDFLIFLDAGDVIEPHALMSIALGFKKHPAWSMVFTDQDSLQPDGKFANPFFKPDFEPDMLRAAPFLADGLLAIRRSTFLELGGLRSASSGAERFELMLRVYENSGENGVGHISDVLCHCPIEGGQGTSTQEGVSASRRRVLQEHLARTGAAAGIEDGVLPGTFRIRYRHDGESAVSIIIPTLNGGAMLQSSVNAVVENTEFKNWELIVVDQESDDADTLAFLDYLRGFNNDAVRVISQPRSSSWPALRNAGARVARQDYLLFLSDSTQPLQGDWLDEMLGYVVLPGVGVVGAKAVGADGKVSNAGYILGLGGEPAGFHDLHAPLDDPGYFGRLQVPGNPSAVSSSCMLTRKNLFDELGGFDEQLLANGYSDVDYCLKVGKASNRVVWTPFALTFQPHRAEPPKEVEADDEDDDAEKHRSRMLPGPTAQVMFDRWLDRIAFDPAYNRNLSLSLATSESYIKGFEIETFPALTWDPDVRPLPRVLAFVGGGEAREEHRIIAPMRALVSAARIQGADTGEFLSIPELARVSPDVLIFQHKQQGHQPKLIESYARNSKALRIFELDVFLSNTQLYQDNGLADTLNLSDRLVVPTEYLAHEYRKFSPEIHVVPDYIERAKWDSLTPQRRQGQKPRVGWAGSAIHEVDLAIISDVVKELHEEVEWVFFGLCPEGTRAMVEYHGGVVNSAYPSKLASLNLDLAISPLADIPYNHAESHLRLLEYGALGYPVICTDITPYRGAYPVTRIRNQSRDWIDAIREHVSDMDELGKRGDAFREYVNGNWMLEDNLDAWRKAWLP